MDESKESVEPVKAFGEERREETPEGLPGLRADLRGLYAPGIKVPAGMDEAILQMAGREMARGRVRRRWYWVSASAAAAVVLAVGAYGVVHWLDRKGRVAPEAVAGRASGKDILVAFDLARRLRAGGPVDAIWDVNGDGKVDQADVDLLAQQAVALPRTGGGAL